MARPISEIAYEITREWGDRMYFGAVPYVGAMRHLDKITDQYGADRGRDIVNYFLANAQNWRGPKAREIKAELKAMLAA